MVGERPFKMAILPPELRSQTMPGWNSQFCPLQAEALSKAPAPSEKVNHKAHLLG